MDLDRRYIHADYSNPDKFKIRDSFVGTKLDVTYINEIGVDIT